MLVKRQCAPVQGCVDEAAQSKQPLGWQWQHSSACRAQALQLRLSAGRLSGHSLKSVQWSLPRGLDRCQGRSVVTSFSLTHDDCQSNDKPASSAAESSKQDLTAPVSHQHNTTHDEPTSNTQAHTAADKAKPPSHQEQHLADSNGRVDCEGEADAGSRLGSQSSSGALSTQGSTAEQAIIDDAATRPRAAERRSEWELVGFFRPKSGRRQQTAYSQQGQVTTVHLSPRRQPQKFSQNTRNDEMSPDVLEKDLSFTPLKHPPPSEVFHNLAMQGLTTLPAYARQAWKTETWALVQIGKGATARLADGRDVTGRGVLLPRIGPFIIGSAVDADCDLILDRPDLAARQVKMEIVHGGSRGRIARLTVRDLKSGDPVWVNRMRLPQGREVEARPRHILTVGFRDLAFQMVPLNGANSVAWDIRVAHRLHLAVPADAPEPELPGRNSPKLWLQLGNAARLRCLEGSRDGLRPDCCMGRVFFRAAVGLLEREALAATAKCEAEVTGAGTGEYARRHSNASRPYAALGRNQGPSARLVQALGWWARLEMHLGCASPSFPSGLARNQDSARRLWRRATKIAGKHPCGMVAGGGLSQLLSWARIEALHGEFSTARYLLDEALSHAPDDRRLHMVTELVTRLQHQAEQLPGVDSSSSNSSLGQVALAASKTRRRRWATLPRTQRPSKDSTVGHTKPV